MSYRRGIAGSFDFLVSTGTYAEKKVQNDFQRFREFSGCTGKKRTFQLQVVLFGQVLGAGFFIAKLEHHLIRDRHRVPMLTKHGRVAKQRPDKQRHQLSPEKGLAGVSVCVKINLDQLKEQHRKKYKKVTADAGYESLDNYQIPFTTAGKIASAVRFIVLQISYPVFRKQKQEDGSMRGYFTASGFYGKVGGGYMLFADETEYYEYMRSEEED